MPTIESSGWPLVFKAEAAGSVARAPDSGECVVGIRTAVRALEGMQKEAIVHYGPTGTTWRMVSDEGPYLNGTDLAPFPLAFYTAGMAFSFLGEMLRLAEERGIAVEEVTITQDNYYTMEGSAIRGDMTGGARPVALQVAVSSDAPPDALAEIAALAERRSPAQAYMRDVLENTFALSLNGLELSVERVCPSEEPLADDPAVAFEQLRPREGGYAPAIIRKLKAAERLEGVEGGAGSSLQSEQKRVLHVRGVATRREDGLMEAVVQLFKPIGSTFRFLCDEGDAEQAPPSLAYLSAGVGFCFMTQLGRYAHIVKQELEAYRIVEDNVFALQRDEEGEERAVAAPVDTHVFVHCDEPEEAARRMLSMGEQTCFLHAAMRTSNPSRVELRVNGKPVAPQDARS